ncbi:MAG: c-type cytochrome biogenesis protein CcmI, partial [Gammaproteobacteria bacterium]|nr:c-type cytochrome biogenesis protein CcmI [Gammaproteobacteria bacterium]
MTLFWVLAVLMILLGLGFILPPLLAKKEEAELGHDELNISIYRQKLADLDKNEDNLSAEELQQARQEIEQSLIQDMDAAAGHKTHADEPAKMGLVIGLAVALPLIALLFYWVKAPVQFEQMLAYDPESNARPAQRNLPPIHEMVAKLEAKMQQNPGDPKGWQLLGRSYFVMGRYDDAAMAYGRAHALAGDEPDLLADYAESLAMGLNGNMQGKPAQLIGRALAKQPDHPKSLWLAGAAEYQNGKFQNAVNHWQRLLSMHPDPQSDGAVTLQKRIDEARAQMGKGPLPATTLQAKAPANKAVGKTQVQVKVDLDPGLKAKANADDTVFIFARAVQGPPMPLAIVKKKVRDLPLTVKLDDSMAMMAN